MLATVLQIAGFVLAVIGLILHRDLFLAGFAIHLVGDLLFEAEIGFKNLSFLDSVSKYVKVPYMVKFLGAMAIVAGAFFSPLKVRIFDFVGLGFLAAGALYNKLYQ